jgi:transcriptional regulator with XRE-family HTH domain
MSLMDIAERLKKAQIAKNFSVYKLSQISGVSETHIRDLKRGDRNPSFDTLSRSVKPLGLTLAEMFRDSEVVSYLNSNERELVECYRMLSDERAEKLLQFLKTLV